MLQSNEAMKCNERFMAQEGIDALAELWEETGKKCYGRHGNTH